MKWFVVGLLALIGFSQVAKADDAGIEAAEKVCGRLSYSKDIQACLEAVQKADYFDTRAVKVCDRLSYSKDIISCIDSIKGKKYTQTAVELCDRESYSANIISCLSKSGRGGDAKKEEKNEAVDKAYVRSSLRKALKAIQDRDSRKAEQIIENLIDTL